MARLFNRAQREALFALSGGTCAICGREITFDNFQADHVEPWSKGGETDVLNGQALCAKCNNEKRDKTVDDLRPWQKRALAEYKAWTEPNFLLVACPAAGKTTAAVEIAKRELSFGIERIVVVVHTDHLKTQWYKAAANRGVELCRDWRPNDIRKLPQGYDGIVATYQQIAWPTNTQMFRKFTASTPTLVILDEVHHAADGPESGWGRRIKEAFAPAQKRLLLSGTPFRSDGDAIPFVDYDENDCCKASFPYSYEKALIEGHCRQIIFPSYEGKVRYHKNGERHETTFSDIVPEAQSRERLNAALTPRGEFMQKVLAEADAKLDEIRRTYPDAGGLVVAKDAKWHAGELAGFLPDSVIATCDEPEPGRTIEAFKESSAKWLVAVKMVSEGVDIPRLRVLVYATNVTTELFFRQAAGRIMRTQGENDDATAYFFFPDDAILREFALHIQEERDHALTETEEEARERIEREQGERSDYRFESSEGQAGNVYLGDDTFSQDEIDRAKAAIEASGGAARWPSPEEFIRANRVFNSGSPATQRNEASGVPLFEEIHALRRENHKWTQRVFHANGQQHTRDEIGRMLARRLGGKIDELSKERLIERLKILNEWAQDGIPIGE